MSWTCNGKTFPTYREANTEHHKSGARIAYKHGVASVIRITDSPSTERAMEEAGKLSTVLGFPIQVTEIKNAKRYIP